MKATTRAQNIVSIAQWYGRALFFPQTHPLGLDDISAYTTRYGAKPDGPESAPWSYQTDPENVTPMNWQAPIVTGVGHYYDPRDGKIYAYGEIPGNNLDPTDPAFTEPPEIA